MPNKLINFTEMSPACGAIIEDLDLTNDLTSQQFDELYKIEIPSHTFY